MIPIIDYFLTGKKQLKGNNSNSLKTIHGVLKGSVIGSLLVIIFINDLYLSVTSSKVIHGANENNLLLIND